MIWHEVEFYWGSFMTVLTCLVPNGFSLMHVVCLWMRLFSTRYAAEISSENSHDLSKFCPCLRGNKSSRVLAAKRLSQLSTSSTLKSEPYPLSCSFLLPATLPPSCNLNLYPDRETLCRGKSGSCVLVLVWNGKEDGTSSTVVYMKSRHAHTWTFTQAKQAGSATSWVCVN